MFFSVLPIRLSSSSRPAEKAGRAQICCEELSERLDEYIFRRRLGKGAYGQVFLAETSSANGRRLVAVKVVRRTKLMKESTRALALAEASNLRHVSATGSLFFMQLHETFCDAHNLYIVTDYLRGGTLRDEMKRRDKGCTMSNDRIVLIIAQLVEALAQLRALRIIHRDIKPDNILLDARGNVVLADFGLSRRFEAGSEDEKQTAQACKLRLGILRLAREGVDEVYMQDDVSSVANEQCLTDTGCGTLAYAAPEMHRGEPYSFQADIYSLGVVCHELLFGHVPPYPKRDDIEADWFLDISPGVITINPAALHLCMALLAPQPSQRISLSALCAHPFFCGVHWPTLSAHAYALPAHHAPPLPPLELARASVIKADMFIDPTAMPEDGPGSALEATYGVRASGELTRRPGDARRWRSRAGRVVRGVLQRTLHIWDCAVGHEGRVRRREWAKDVKCGRGEPFVRTVERNSSFLPATTNAQLVTHSFVDDESRTLSAGPQSSSLPCSISMVASDGHRDSPRVSERPIHPALRHATAQTIDRPRTLRRITTRIPSRPRVQSPSTMPCETALCSTTAIFSRAASESELLSSTKHPRPVLPRLSTALPLSSPDSVSSSFSPRSSSSRDVSFLLARALEQALPSSSSEPALMPTSGMQVVPPCPSLVASMSSFPPTPGLVTPIRGRSFAPGIPSMEKQTYTDPGVGVEFKEKAKT